MQAWSELRSTHFRLRTDQPPDAARETLEKLEHLRTWLQAAWSTGGDSPGSTNAIVLDDPDELWTFTHIPGIATTTRQGPIIVTAGSGREFLLGDRSPAQQVLAHEVAHDLIRRRMPGAPRWFHEGLAGYLETVTRLDDRRVRFGGSATHLGPGAPKWHNQPEIAVRPGSRRRAAGPGRPARRPTSRGCPGTGPGARTGCADLSAQLRPLSSRIPPTRRV